jgi:glycosyltransferase involved in cell wall biosynthesis
MIVSIVLGTYNRCSFLKLTIDGIRKEVKNINHEIIVVDGGSTDGTLKWLMKQKDIITIVQHNRGVWQGKQIERRSWGYFMNLGFKSAQGKYVCMLSDDCLIVPGAIVNGVNNFEEQLNKGKKVGALAFYWRNWPDDKNYYVGLTLGNKLFVNHGLYLKQALEQIGYADEEKYLFYHADGDLCLKMWEIGYLCLDAPNSYIEHFNHANLSVRKTNIKNQASDWNYYLSRWENIFYNPELKNIGSWLEKDYQDKNGTAKTFYALPSVRYVLVRSNFRKKLMRFIKNVFK